MIVNKITVHDRNQIDIKKTNMTFTSSKLNRQACRNVRRGLVASTLALVTLSGTANSRLNNSTETNLKSGTNTEYKAEKPDYFSTNSTTQKKKKIELTEGFLKDRNFKEIESITGLNEIQFNIVKQLIRSEEINRSDGNYRNFHYAGTGYYEHFIGPDNFIIRYSSDFGQNVDYEYYEYSKMHKCFIAKIPLFKDGMLHFLEIENEKNGDFSIILNGFTIAGAPKNFDREIQTKTLKFSRDGKLKNGQVMPRENLKAFYNIKQNNSSVTQKNNQLILSTLYRDMEICPFSFDRENEFADIFLTSDLINLPIPLDGTLKKVINHTGATRFNTEKNFKYDNKNRVIEISHSKPIEFNTNKKYSYNSQGLIDKIYHNKGAGRFDTYRLHEYNSQGQLVHIKHKVPIEFDTSRDFKYDGQGRLINIHYNIPAEFDREDRISYGSNGKVSVVEHSNPADFNTKTIYEYDGQNRLTKMTYVTNPLEFNKSKIFKYNNKGQLIKIENRMPPGEFDTSTQFEYDSKGRLKFIVHNTPPGEFNQKTEFVWE